ncbi:hypothetical protein BQ1740_2103 [Bacillus subtilis]|nr:hypothetical protein BQ1740_2103 [Bacillus subtilis]
MPVLNQRTKPQFLKKHNAILTRVMIKNKVIWSKSCLENDSSIICT